MRSGRDHLLVLIIQSWTTFAGSSHLTPEGDVQNDAAAIYSEGGKATFISLLYNDSDDVRAASPRNKLRTVPLVHLVKHVCVSSEVRTTIIPQAGCFRSVKDVLTIL